VVNKKTKEIICTAFGNGKKHDFKLFKESKVKIEKKIKVITDSGYQGIKDIHAETELPKKSSKKHKLSKEEKKKNREITRERVLNENVIGMIKRFKIISDKYRNRRKRFGLRFSLISGVEVYNRVCKIKKGEKKNEERKKKTHFTARPASILNCR
jgi:hypothetical protein